MTEESQKIRHDRRSTRTGSVWRVPFEPENGLWPNGDDVALPPRALAVLAALVAHPGTVVSKRALMDDDLQLASGHAASDRILVRQGGVTPARRELRVVLEWFAEVTRLVRLPA